jgi:periplasmic protein TonB
MTFAFFSWILGAYYCAEHYAGGGSGFPMFDPKPFVPKPDRRLLPAPRAQGSGEPKQRRMMAMALALLLVALGIVLYRDRDFWFPDAQEALEPPDSQPTQSASTPTTTTQTTVTKASTPVAESRHRGVAATAPRARDSAPVVTPPSQDTPPVAAITRTVLPPLEVEVVAGDVHRAVQPGGNSGSNSVRVDLQPGSPADTVSEATPASVSPATTASLTNASERVEMSADASEIVSRPVRPGYPMLARQMKVQGSVILQALISRDGAIQDLHVMSGPPILAGAAREAVKQWRFKPHYQGAEAVETQAKITVNFTISTN